MKEMAKILIGIFKSRISKESEKTQQALISKNFMQFDDYNYQLMNKQLFK